MDGWHLYESLKGSGGQLNFQIFPRWRQYPSLVEMSNYAVKHEPCMVSTSVVKTA